MACQPVVYVTFFFRSDGGHRGCWGEKGASNDVLGDVFRYVERAIRLPRKGICRGTGGLPV